MSKPLPDHSGFEQLPLGKRRITLETVEKFDVTIGKDEHGETVQSYPYHGENGAVIAYKYRYPGKEFRIVGNGSKLPLFGKNLWPAGGKKIIITEGELDALAMSQVQGNRWPVVSLPNGAKAAAASLKRELGYLETFDQVILCFDNDEHGQAAVEACMPLFSPGRLKVMELPLKDASDMVAERRDKDLISAMWSARTYAPDWFIAGEDITYDMITKEGTVGYTTQYPDIDAVTRGIRKGEVTLFTGGTGSGKSTILREISHHFMKVHGLKVASVYLEESEAKTAAAYVALDHNLHLGSLRQDKTLLTEEQWNGSIEWMREKASLVRHFGSLDSDELMARLRYLVTGWGADFIVLDHVSIVVSGMETSNGDVKALDLLMTSLATLSAETSVGILVVSHLRKGGTGAKNHERGAEVNHDDLRGSSALKQIPDTIIAVERDQQDPSVPPATVRVLKNREWSTVGLAGYVSFDMKTGRLTQSAPPVEADDNPFKDAKDEDDY